MAQKSSVWLLSKDCRTENSWSCLRNRGIKGKREGHLTAAQDQCLNTRNYRNKTLGQNIESVCRVCNQADETVSHIISKCPSLAKRIYLHRHNQVARIFHWELCGMYIMERSSKWYQHTPEYENVITKDHMKILWDFNIHTDKVIHHRRPDIVVVNSADKTVEIIDVAITGDNCLLYTSPSPRD